MFGGEKKISQLVKGEENLRTRGKVTSGIHSEAGKCILLV